MANKLRDYSLELWRGLKPYVLTVFLQFGFALLTIIAKFALNEGMSTFTFVVYRHALATAVIAPFALVFERPVLDQNIYYLGMRMSSATFTATMGNVIPAITFIFAWILRLEVVDLKEVRSVAKVVGTIVSISGAMVMTLYKGPTIGKGSPRLGNNYGSIANSSDKDMVKGSIFLIIACCCWSGFIILQTLTLREYPLELTLSALICIMGAAEGTVAALIMERGHSAAWSIGWNSKLLAIVFSAVVCSGMAYTLQGSVMKEKGPVFVTAFSPLSMILVAAAGLVFLREDLFLGGLVLPFLLVGYFLVPCKCDSLADVLWLCGRVIGSLLIVLGLYMVAWGKSKDPPLNDQNLDVQLATDA